MKTSCIDSHKTWAQLFANQSKFSLSTKTSKEIFFWPSCMTQSLSFPAVALLSVTDEWKYLKNTGCKTSSFLKLAVKSSLWDYRRPFEWSSTLLRQLRWDDNFVLEQETKLFLPLLISNNFVLSDFSLLFVYCCFNYVDHRRVALHSAHPPVGASMYMCHSSKDTHCTGRRKDQHVLQWDLSLTVLDTL